MYLNAFGMKRLPFNNDITVDGLYRSDNFTEALSRLKFACCNQQFAILTAVPGCGKTTLLRTLRASIDPLKFEFLYISDSSLTPRWLYNNLLAQLGCRQYLYRGDGRKALHEQIQIIRGVKNKSIICCIDEAHLLDIQDIEEIRFLLNCDMDSLTPMALILSGQNELKDRLKRVACCAVAQRIKIVCSLEPMTKEQMQKYIQAHLDYSMTTVKDIFTADALDEIYKYSSGIPRLVNNACHVCLLSACMRENPQIDGQLVQTVVKTELF